MTALPPGHAMTQTDTVTTFYPPHPTRVATDVYARSHHELTVVEDKPCWACGLKHSDLPAKAPVPGTAMETHHFWMEDAFTGEGGDPGGIFWPRVQADHPDFDWTGSGFNINDPATYKFFVDSTYNLQVLCSGCHRAAKSVPHWLAGQPDADRGNLLWTPDAGSVGIHHATYPEYRDQRHALPTTPPFRVVAGQGPSSVPPHTLIAADAAALRQLRKTPIAGHVILHPDSGKVVAA